MELKEFLDHVDSGALVEGGSEHHRFMHDAAQDAFRITAELNAVYRRPGRGACPRSGELTGRTGRRSVTVFPPFHSEFGRTCTSAGTS